MGGRRPRRHHAEAIPDGRLRPVVEYSSTCEATTNVTSDFMRLHHGRRLQLPLLLAALLTSACARKAIEEGTCTEDDDANFALCIEANCSAYKSNEATAFSACEGSLDVIAQSGSGECSFSGSGECEVVCTCSNGGTDSAGGSGSDGSGSGGSGSGGSGSGGSGGSGSDGSGSGDSGSDGSGSDGSDGSDGSGSGDSGSDGSGSGDSGSDGSGSDGSGSDDPSNEELCDAVCTDLWPCIWGDLHATVDCTTCDTWGDALIECLYECEDSCSCAVDDCGMAVLGE